MTPSYAIVVDSNGNGIGSHKWEDSTTMVLATNEVECTEAQAQNPTAWQVVNGALVESLPAAKATQSGIIAAACSAAESAPLSFTNASGTAGVFPMDSSKLAKYLGAYAKYVAKGVPFPNSATTYNFYTVTGQPVGMTVTDIDNFFNAVESQVDAALAKQATLLADIAAATTVSAVQSIVW